jgi:GntR family transcriptional regulator
VCQGVAAGELTSGDPLPPIRQLAKDLSVTPATIAKAYQILAHNKIIATGGRRGTYIHESAHANVEIFQNVRLKKRTRDFIQEQLRSGVSKEVLKSVFIHEINSHKGDKQ